MIKNTVENNIIKENMKAAIRGKKIYKQLLKNFKNEKMRKIDDWSSAVLLFPSHDNEINFYGLLYLDEFLFRTNCKRVSIITTDNKVTKAFKKLYPKNQDIYQIKDSEMFDILLYYRLYPFDNRIKVLSLEEPLGRRANNLLGVKKISKEMLIGVGIYCLIPFQKIILSKQKEAQLLSIFNEEILYEHC